ncbi:hypothetical protein [Paramaledivibacter caminithermalis]|nr:hypothetical protein [Paramaledivibacter caminithermalis]
MVPENMRYSVRRRTVKGVRVEKLNCYGIVKDDEKSQENQGFVIRVHFIM